MDAQRFDNLAKTLAGRLSRRNALRRMGAAASASVLAAAGLQHDQAQALVQAQSDDKPLYTIIRRYSLNAPTGKVRKALQQGYTDAACKAPGFVAYLTVEDEDGDFATVAVFKSQDALEDFAKQEAAWIAKNLDDMLPAPDESISGDTYIHAMAQKGFANTCPASEPQKAATVAPASEGALPTAAPANPTPTPQPTATPEPACRDDGCVCTTGTDRACKGDLVCCPTTDLMGGPGICRTQAACYPDQCIANDASCPQVCLPGNQCGPCCSGYCDATGLCNVQTPPCTGVNCACTAGVINPCAAGLVCCSTTQTPGAPGVCQLEADCVQQCTGVDCACTTGTLNQCANGLICCAASPDPGSPGSCQAEADCHPSCTGRGCDCNGGVQGNCDAGLVCCQPGESIPGGAGTCLPEAECGPAPCTAENCPCISGTAAPCDDGLVCCGNGTPGGAGTCLTEAACNPDCTAEGCECNGGVFGACDDGLVCCQGGESAPGGRGTCQPTSQCTPPACTGAGCSCNGGVQGNCDAGLVCCQDDASIPGGIGVCVVEGSCFAQGCDDEGVGCAATCDWGAACPSCCTGFCTANGVCGSEGVVSCVADGDRCPDTCAWSDGCTDCCAGFCDGSGICREPGASAGACGDEGCQCGLGNPACVDGLLCCDDGSGVTGTCLSVC